MSLKHKLEYYYRTFDKSKLEPDPLQFLHLYNDERDIEMMGFIGSIFAYGSVKQIGSTLNKIVKAVDNRPYSFIRDFDSKKDASRLDGINHRFYTNDDVKKLFILLGKEVNRNQSVRNIFLKGYLFSDYNVKKGISNLSNHFLNSSVDSFGENSNGIKFMFPLPERNSACKRMNLFLRWMVRKDELDTGIWSEVGKDKLVIPVDTHIARICRHLNLTTRKSTSWQMAEEITDNLKVFDADDPVKYDFAICHIGIRKLKF